MSAPSISVLTPAYEAAGTIAEAIDSVRAQTLSDWELIVVDDGSADATAAVVRSYADDRIRLITQERQGVSAARNRAFEHSRGALIAFLDADDRFAPTKLAVQSEFLAQQPEIGSTYCAHRRIDLAGEPWTMQSPPWEAGYREFLLGFPFNPSAQMVRREWHQKSGGFLPGLEIHEDRDYWLRLCAQGCRFARSPGVLADYRLGPPKPTANLGENLCQMLEVLDRGLALPPADTLSSEERIQPRSDIYQEWAFQAALSGLGDDAANLYGELLRLRPDLVTDAGQRDAFLCASVDVCVRSRGEHEELLTRIFATLPKELGALRRYERWAAGCGAVLRGARELLWDRPQPAQESFRRAQDLGAGLDERTASLLRWDLQQFQGASQADALGPILDRLCHSLSGLTSRAQAAAFRRSVEPSAMSSSFAQRAARRVRSWIVGVPA